MDRSSNTSPLSCAVDSEEPVPRHAGASASSGGVAPLLGQVAVLAPDRSPLHALTDEARRAHIPMITLDDHHSTLQLPAHIRIVVVDQAVLQVPTHEFVRDFRSASAVGIVIVAEQSSATQRILALESGADEFLSPIPEVGELLARLRSRVRRVGPESASSSSSTRFAFDGWSLDRLARSLFSPAGIPVHLTAREFDALALMLEAANQPVERARFNAAELNAESRAPDALVGRLRRKLLAAGASKRLIRPVRSSGYILSADVRRL